MSEPPRTGAFPTRFDSRSAGAVLLALAVASPARPQALAEPPAGSEAGSATIYGEESIADVDPLGVSTRWIDPGQAGNLMSDRIVRTRAMTPSEAARAALDPSSGAARGYAYRAPGVRATFHRAAYVTWTVDGPRVNGAIRSRGSFKEIIPPDTVFDLTPPPVPAAELTAFSAGMLSEGRLPVGRPSLPLDRRVDLRTGAPLVALAEPVAAPVAPPPPAQLQPWVRLRVDENGRTRIDDAATAGD